MNVAVSFTARLTANTKGFASRSDAMKNEATYMANTFSALYYHFVFSTKNRHPYISAEHESRVWAFIGGIARKNGYAPIQIGGTDDHIHALISAKTSDAPSRIAQHLKGESSKWIHETFPE